MKVYALLIVLALLLPAAPGFAWSYKEHVVMTRLAAYRILSDEAAPDDLKAWIRNSVPEAHDLEAIRRFAINTRLGPTTDGLEGLAFWSVHPDTDRGAQVPLFGINEGKMHYIDIEFFHPNPAKRTYQPDGSGKPQLSDIPRDKTNRIYVDAGYLPLRIEQCYDELVHRVASGRLSGEDEAGELDHAVAWAGYLAHYLQDNTQPHHATADFKSESYFAGSDAKPNVHGMMEYGFVDDEAMAYPGLRQAYFNGTLEALDALDAAGVSHGNLGDPFATSLKTSFDAYDYLPLIGEAAVEAVRRGSAGAPDLVAFAQFRRNGGPTLMEMKVRQTALAVVLTEAAWRQAWAEARGEYERPDEHRTPGVSKAVR